MSALVICALLLAGSVLALRPHGGIHAEASKTAVRALDLRNPDGPRGAPGQPGTGRWLRGPARKVRPHADDELPLLVHQLAGLLEAGRPPAALWADAAALCRTGEAGKESHRVAVLTAAARTARLGLSVAPVLRQAAAGGAERPGSTAAGRHELWMWRDLAACVQVAELSGAPLAGLLQRYAAAMEADLDARAARTNALAGPRATVRLMTWLPAGGLLLGYALGADPIGTLFGSGIGIAALVGGLALSLAGRIWSRRLVALASHADGP